MIKSNHLKITKREVASFRKFGDTWEFRVRYKDPYTQKYKEKSKRGFKAKKEARIAGE